MRTHTRFAGRSWNAVFVHAHASIPTSFAAAARKLCYPEQDGPNHFEHSSNQKPSPLEVHCAGNHQQGRISVWKLEIASATREQVPFQILRFEQWSELNSQHTHCDSPGLLSDAHLNSPPIKSPWTTLPSRFQDSPQTKDKVEGVLEKAKWMSSPLTGAQLEVRDVSTNEAWERQFGMVIPVLTVLLPGNDNEIKVKRVPPKSAGDRVSKYILAAMETGVSADVSSY